MSSGLAIVTSVVVSSVERRLVEDGKVSSSRLLRLGEAGAGEAAAANISSWLADGSRSSSASLRDKSSSVNSSGLSGCCVGCCGLVAGGGSFVGCCVGRLAGSGGGSW